MVLMLLPDPSGTSDPGSEVEPPLEPGFLLVAWTVGSAVKEPLPGAVPLRSGGTFSLSTEEEEECDNLNTCKREIMQLQEKKRKKP